jgi:signal transduction histidine kinase
MKSNLDAKFKTRDFVLKYRWPLMALLALSYIVMEVIEHSNSPHGLNFTFHIELWHYGLLVPLVGGIFLSLLARTEGERDQAVHQLDLKHELSVQLSSIENWDELCAYLVDFPRTIAPFCEVSLFLYDQVIDEFQLVRRWTDSSDAARSRKSWPRAMDAATLTAAGTYHALTAEIYENLEMGDECPAFSLPLVHGKLLIASYILRVPSHSRLTTAEMELLNSVAPSIALAVDVLHPLGSRLAQAEAISAEQRRLSRYLHDTVSQDIAFLLLKLEELQDEEILHDAAAVQKALVKMHDVADQAYRSARDIMDDLYPFDGADLATVLYRQARLEFGEQSKIQVEIISDGEEQDISPNTRRNILGIFRESLINVRKHARANRFKIHLSWEDENLTMILRDDGDGFDVANTPINGHYGLRIIRERAEEIGGRLSLVSESGRGTEVKLIVPIGDGSKSHSTSLETDGVADAIIAG